MSSSCCLWTWLLIFATSIWITGLTIGIIGAVGFAPLSDFRNNAKTSTCTLQSSFLKVNRCSKWGNCLSVTWQSTHPDLNDATTTVSAAVIEKTGLGYSDALTWRAKRKSGDVVSCFIHQNDQSHGYFNLPGTNYLAELVIGWIFFFLGTFIWVIFFMWVCCSIKVWKCCSSKVWRCCKCDCSSSSSSSKVRSAPLYSAPANPLYANTSYVTSPASARSSASISRVDTSSFDDAEMTPIPPTNPTDPYIEPEGGYVVDDGAGAGAGAGATPYNEDTGAGAGAGY